MAHLFHDLIGVTEGRVVDLGCGRGDHLYALRDLGFDVIGIDGEPGGCVDHTCAFDKDRIPLPDNSVDVVFSKSVIEHLYLPGVDNFMRETKRILKPGGIVAICTPDWVYCYPDFFTGFTHVTPFSTRSLRHCLKMYGFVDVETHVLIQLPQVWNSKAMKFLSDVTMFFPLKARFYHWSKWIRWSKQRMAFGIARKLHQ